MMAKIKRGTPPLFELLEGNRLRRGDVTELPKLRVINADSQVEETDSSPGKTTLSTGSPERLARPAEHAVLQFLGDRLHVSLTPVTAAVGLFAIALVVLGAVYFGQRRGEKAALRAVTQAGLGAELQDVDVIRRQPPATHLVEGLLAEGSKPAAPQIRPTEKSPAKSQPNPLLSAQAESAHGPQYGWVRDLTYIMAQEFAAGRSDDARRAQEFLKSKGFAAEIVKLENGALQLITLEGYNHKDPAQKKKADALLKKERAAGADYFASGGGYKLEGYFKTLKKDQW